MTKQLLRAYLFAIIHEADAHRSLYNPTLTKAAVWNMLLRQCWQADGEELVDKESLHIFITEFNSYILSAHELTISNTQLTA